MTRYHYLLARNPKKRWFMFMTLLEKRLLIQNGSAIELWLPIENRWVFAPRLRMPCACGPEDFLGNAAYRVSELCKPPNFKETK